MLKRHSGVAQAAYSDLLGLLRDDMAGEIQGTPELRRRGARGYWYDRYRVGNETKARYIGEDNDALRARINRHKDLAEQRRERSRERGRLVRLLRAEGLRGSGDDTGPLLAAMAKLGVFRLGGTLVGTNAFRLYEGELGVRFPVDEIAMTVDLDVAQFEKLSFALEDTVSAPLERAFAVMKFDPMPSLDHRRTWRWQQGTGVQSVEFLTPAFGEEELRDLPALGVSAMALRHLNYLIREPIHAAVIYRSGVLVQIPAPERYAIHKLIVSERRMRGADSNKAAKDRAQAAFLIAVLGEDRPSDLYHAYEEAKDEGPKWASRIEAALNKMPETREILLGCAY